MALKQYRVRIYEDGNYEIETKRRHLKALDLETPAGLAIAHVELERSRQAIATRLGYSERSRARLRLAVHEWPGDDYVMDWCG